MDEGHAWPSHTMDRLPGGRKENKWSSGGGGERVVSIVKFSAAADSAEDVRRGRARPSIYPSD